MITSPLLDVQLLNPSARREGLAKVQQSLMSPKEGTATLLSPEIINVGSPWHNVQRPHLLGSLLPSSGSWESKLMASWIREALMVNPKRQWFVQQSDD